MPSLAQRAELLKLARLLGEPAGSLHELEALPAPALRELRHAATAALFDAERRRFIGMANASRMLPLPLLVKIIERAFGPLLCARTAGMLPVERAIAVAERLETGFLTDTCIELDPRSAAELVASFPVERVVEIARELVRRGELVTMGRFIDSVTLDAIAAVMAAIEDDAVLLKVSFFAEEVSRLNEIVELLPPARLARIIRTAAEADADTWGEAMALMSTVDPSLSQRLAAITGAFETPVLERILRSTEAIGCWNVLVPIVATMPNEQQQHIAGLMLAQPEPTLRALLDAAQASGQVAQLQRMAALDPHATLVLAKHFGGTSAAGSRRRAQIP